MTPTVLQRIEHLDAKADHQEIVRIVGGYEYPFLMQKAVEFAMFRTYAIPLSSALLHHTKHFENQGQKRYDDTALLVAEWVEHGYDSERGRAAIRPLRPPFRADHPRPEAVGGGARSGASAPTGDDGARGGDVARPSGARGRGVARCARLNQRSLANRPGCGIMWSQ